VRHHQLLLYGTSPIVNNAVVWINLIVRRHGHRTWVQQSKVKLTHTRFSCSIRLPSAWRRVHATLEILYKGGNTYRLTKLHRTLLI
jgi:hypothetical protein